MKVILQQGCETFTGRLDSYTGYHIQRRKNGYFAKRDSKGKIPSDGHWRFIVLCAEQAGGLYFADIKVSKDELREALREAHCFVASQNLRLEIYHARDVLNLKTVFGL